MQLESGIETSVAKLYLEDDIMIMRAKSFSTFNLEVTKEIVVLRKELQQGISMPMLVDTRLMFQGTNESREYGSTKEGMNLISALAILSGASLSARLTGNFFIQINKPQIPTKLFKKEKNAIKWLNTFK